MSDDGRDAPFVDPRALQAIAGVSVIDEAARAHVMNDDVLRAGQVIVAKTP